MTRVLPQGPYSLVKLYRPVDQLKAQRSKHWKDGYGSNDQQTIVR